MTESNEQRTDAADSAPTPDSRLWLFRLLALILVPLLFFTVTEGALRLAGVGYDARFFVPLDGHDSLTTNPAFGWRFFPPSLARRPVECAVSADKPPDTLRVLVFGGLATMGIPDPAYSFGRILEIMLGERFPEHRVEVINAAMTAINSHVVLPIVRDSWDLDADLMLLYMGNNEVVGPWGAGSVLGGGSSDTRLIRAGIRFSGTRLGQLLGRLAGAIRRQQGPTGWRGMAMFTEHRLAADDPRLTEVYGNFQANLSTILDLAERRGVPLIGSTVAVNLADSAPFAATHRPGLSDDEQQRWQALFDTAAAHAAAGDCDNANDRLAEAQAIDDRRADLHYLLGRCHLAAGRMTEASEHLSLARDLDSLRFRADSEINRLIRETVSERQGRGIFLVDAEQTFAQASGGVPGNDLFFEHVHLNFAGGYLLAKTIFAQATAVLEKRGIEGRPTALPDAATCAQRLAFTPWDQHRVAADMDRLMATEPFSFQVDRAPRAAVRREQLAELQRVAGSAAGQARSQEIYQQALAARADDPFLLANHAQLLLAVGQPVTAAARIQQALEIIPGHPNLLTDLGNALTEVNEFDKAADAYHRVDEVDPYGPSAPFNLGVLEVKRERFEIAQGYFEAALQRDPSHLKSLINLANALEYLKRPDEALDKLRQAVELAPDDGVSQFHLAAALSKRGRPEEAVGHYRSAIRARPTDIQAIFNLGVTLARLGQATQAARQYQRVLELDDSFVQARDNLAELHNQQGAEQARTGDLAAAVESFRRAVEVRPEHASLRHNLAQALGLAGSVEAAIVELEATLRLARASGNLELAGRVESQLTRLANGN